MTNNVWAVGWTASLWDNIKNIFRNIKYSWQRIMRGYCDRDLWNLDYYYCQLISDSLSDFAEQVTGYPDQKYDSLEKWQNACWIASAHFINALPRDQERNPFADWYERFIKEHSYIEVINNKELSLYDRDMKQQFLDWENKQDKVRQEHQDIAMKWLTENLNNLWD